MPTTEQQSFTPKQISDLNASFAKNRIFAFNTGMPRREDMPDVRDPNPLQRQLIEAWKDPQYKVFTYTGGNRIGKTTLGAIIAIATCAGEWPWDGTKLPLFGSDPVRKVRICGQGWESSIKTVIIPALKFWWPESYSVETRKNNQGCDYFWELKDGRRVVGTIEIMSTSQAAEVFEGWQGNLVIYDEPPPRDIRVACARGLIDRQGRELFTCTLLNRAWIHREVIKARLPDGSPDMTVYNVCGSILTNVGYGITQEGVDQFAKMLTDDEKEARINGKPSYLSTLVCPRFDRQQHVKERFKIPLDAIITVNLDWHPSKPAVATFMATLKNGYKYICDEMKFRGHTKSAAEEVIRIIRMRDYARIERIQIDPLSKSGMPNETDAFSVFEETFAAFGYALEVASKSKESGIQILNNLLWSENDCPALFFFRDCVNSIEEVESLMFDPETGKPMKDKDDHFETIYRNCLLDVQWYPVWENKNSGSAVSVML